MILAIVRHHRQTPHHRGNSIVYCLATLVIGSICILSGLFSAANAFAADVSQRPAVQPCELSDSDFDPSTDVKAFDEHQDAIAQLLTAEDFTQLDCLADAARTGKTRFPGGSWKLRNIYLGLNSPGRGHVTDLDWRQRIDLVQHWTEVQPQSVTARIALAESYVGYAWFARGDDAPNTVSESGWRLFRERLETAKAILNETSSLPAKCPEWYVAMQQVAVGQDWDLVRFKELFEQALTLEPGYDSYYRMAADYFQHNPKSTESDAAKFAQETADRIGGTAGDIVYFYAAEEILSPYENPAFQHFSWPRLQTGFLALEKQFGSSLIDLNSFALMASKNSDWVAADETFKRVGENWDEKTWTSELCFEQNRSWAVALAPGQVQARIYRHEAEKNLQTRKGRSYAARVRPKLAIFEQSCSQQSGGQPAFDLLMQISKRGGLEECHTEIDRNPFTMCLVQTLEATYFKKETPFPRPPKNGYKILLNVDPSSISGSTK